VTPRENPEVNGPWMCNKGRDLAAIYERTRANEGMQKGKPVDLDAALAAARRLLEGSTRPLALVSSWGSNEELEAFRRTLSARFTAWVKADHVPQPGERLDDDLLIRADKNPNTAGAQALFPERDDGVRALPADTDLVLVWGEGFDFARLPAKARVIFLNSYLQPENGHADVFIPISVATERRGHYTNCEGTVSAFAPCFAKPAGVADAATAFAAIALTEDARA
jgi:NADH-quinone oxidoreductase subunit G